MSVKRFQLDSRIPNERAEKELPGRILGPADYDYLVQGDCDVLKPDG